jgi:hypothetical protein
MTAIIQFCPGTCSYSPDPLPSTVLSNKVKMCKFYGHSIHFKKSADNEHQCQEEDIEPDTYKNLNPLKILIASERSNLDWFGNPYSHQNCQSLLAFGKLALGS